MKRNVSALTVLILTIVLLAAFGACSSTDMAGGDQGQGVNLQNTQGVSDTGQEQQLDSNDEQGETDSGIADDKDDIKGEEKASVKNEETEKKSDDVSDDVSKTSGQEQKNPPPVNPQDIKPGKNAYVCTLSVRCDIILKNMDDFNPQKLDLLPEDGIVFYSSSVTFYEGESVFNVLQREMKKAKIHMESRSTPIYNSSYIMGINNIYEFDCGELSGWMYKVNGWFPNYGTSRYQLKAEDVIEVVYTCDLGRDIGATDLKGWQQ